MIVLLTTTTTWSRAAAQGHIVVNPPQQQYRCALLCVRNFFYSRRTHPAERGYLRRRIASIFEIDLLITRISGAHISHGIERNNIIIRLFALPSISCTKFIPTTRSRPRSER